MTLTQTETPTGTAAEQRSRGFMRRFFGVIARPATWLNLVYLALAFPLGLFYFIFFVTMLSVGLSLIIIWVGIPILAATAMAAWVMATLERGLADGLLGTDTSPAPRPWQRATGMWPRAKAHLGSTATWKDFAFLFVKFPLGLFTFVVLTVAASVPLSFIGAPFYYRWAQSGDIDGHIHHGIYLGFWTVDTLPEALLLVPVGFVLLVVALHVLNGLAVMWRTVCRALLEKDDGRAAAVPPPAPTPGPAVASPFGVWSAPGWEDDPATRAPDALPTWMERSAYRPAAAPTPTRTAAPAPPAPPTVPPAAEPPTPPTPPAPAAPLTDTDDRGPTRAPRPHLWEDPDA